MDERIVKNNIKSICFVTPEYPIEGDMTNTFVDALICEIARQGIKCTVIAPFDVFRYVRKQGKKRKRHWTRKVTDDICFEVYAPRYCAFLGHKGIADLSSKIYNRTVLNEFRRLSQKMSFDAVYGHFFGMGGVPAQMIGSRYNIPSFVACGESSLKKMYGNENQKRYIKCIEGITGIVCVSTKNKEEIIDTWGSEVNDLNQLKRKMKVFPNAYYPEEFFKMDKKAVREELGIKTDCFMISFLGRFQEHKGIGVLNQALKDFDDVGSIFLGKGDFKLDCPNICFCGQVNHDSVAKYLNASDVFVLPTRAEGCSNAIVEALACGLPVISSNLPFNTDILNETNSILLNPLSADEISSAIALLKNNEEKRLQLSEGALLAAEKLTIGERTLNILQFMNDKIEERHHEI